MISFQGPAAVASQAQPSSQTTGLTSEGPLTTPSAAAATGGGRNCQQQMSRQLQQQQHCQQQLSLLTNQSQRDDCSDHEPMQRSIGASSSLSPSPTSGQNQTGGNQKSSHASGRRVSSPGYHSAASSPGSSVSSSAASSASSSGVSSASSDNHANSSSSNNNNNNNNNHALMMALTTNSTGQQQNQRHLNQAQNHHNKRSSFGSQTITCTTASIMSGPQVARLSLNHSHHQDANRAMNQQNSSGCNPPTLLDYYPEARQDGLNLSWFHAANSRQTLSKALASERAIVAGDISLAELSRYPVPIMARPPLGSSDLTLENWLIEVIQARKGIKLTFTSTRTVEPAFRVLARHADHLKGPIILSADILTRPTGGGGGGVGGTATGQSLDKSNNAKQQPVDAWTFLMLCRTRFPKSIISIGWCSAASQQQQQPLELNPRQGDSTGESMFELDMMLEQQIANPTHHQIQFNSALLNLSTNQRVNDNLNSLHVVQQLAAAAAAAAASNNHLDGAQTGANHHHNHLLSNHHHPYHVLNTANVHHQQQPTRNQHANYTLSSTGSLTSSSGNSSGSPSPTSPIGHMLMNHQRHQLQMNHHHHLHNNNNNNNNQHLQHTSSAEQLMLAAAAAAAASAADSEGAKMSHPLTKQAAGGRRVWPVTSSTSKFKHEMIDEEEEEEEEREVGAEEHDLDDEDEEEEEEEDNSDECHQLPLNLNINEADPQHAAAAAAAASSSALKELAKQIKSFQRQQSSNPLSEPNCQPAAAISLTKRLLSANQIGPAIFNNNNNNNTPLESSSNKWEHISKKAALANRLNSNSPSPVSTSPKHQLQSNLLCVRPNLSQQQHQQQQQRPTATTRHLVQTKQTTSSADQLVGYTREMIDKMASLVKEYNLTQPITFSVEARLLNCNSQIVGPNNSLGELQRLLYQVGSNSSLTVVAQPEDLISVEDLLTIRKHFATNQILFDLPDELAASLRQELELH